MSKDISDIELIRRCINDNDIDAWEEFVRKFSRLVWTSIRKTYYNYSFQHSQEDIEDMYSSLFLSLMENDFKKLRQFKSKNACSVSTWLAIITVRSTIDFLRKDKSHLSVDSGEKDQDLWDIVPDHSQRADRKIETFQNEREFERSVQTLSPKDRMIYDMLYRKGFSAEETAEMLGMTVASIYTRKHRIIEKIKKAVTDL